MRITITLASVALLTFLSGRAFAQQNPGDQRNMAPRDEERQWLYLMVEGGGARADLRTFMVNEQSMSVGFARLTGNGPFVGLGGGLRVAVVTLGPRVRFSSLEGLNLTTAGGEIGVRVPVWRLEPHIDVGFGYVNVGGMTTRDEGRRALDADGYYGRIGGGVDFKVTRAFSVGAIVSWEYLGVMPDGMSTSTIAEIQSAVSRADLVAVEAGVRKAEGSSYGSAFSFGVQLGLHY